MDPVSYTHLLAAVAHWAELKGRVVLGGGVILAVGLDQRIGLTVALDADIVLQMHDRAAACVFFNVGSRVLAGILDPAGIQLRGQQAGGHSGIKEIQPILAAELDKLKVVVMIQQLDARRAAQLAEGVDLLNEDVYKRQG